jgi:hypothetical protein
MKPAELFVWYRAAPADVPRVSAEAMALLARVEAACGVRGRLLRRSDERCTWMEHYRIGTGEAAFQAALQQALGEWQGGLPERHSEYFEAVPPDPAGPSP